MPGGRRPLCGTRLLLSGEPQAGGPPGRARFRTQLARRHAGPSDGMGDVEGTPRSEVPDSPAALSLSMTLREAEKERGHVGVKCWGTGPKGRSIRSRHPPRAV